MKNISIFRKNNEVNKNEKTKEENVMTQKWSLKKKLMIGGGIVTGVILGAVALMNKGKQSVDESCDDEDENDEEFNVDEVENEVENEVNIEN